MMLTAVLSRPVACGAILHAIVPARNGLMTTLPSLGIDLLMTDNNSQEKGATAWPEGAIPAATLVIMRSAESGGADEILMVKRAKTMAFAAGAVVFPGGRIDPDDYCVAARHGFAADDAEAAARVAALRETLEETGLAVGWPDLAEDQVDAVRRALLADTLLSEILEQRGERLALDSLVYDLNQRNNLPAND